MAKLIEITGKVLSGEWGTDDETGNGIPVLRTTNFTNEGIVDYSNVVTRNIVKKGIEEKYLRNGDIIIEKSGGSDKQPVGRVIYFDGPERTYLFNNFTGLLRVKNQEKWHPRYVFYLLFSNYRSGGTRTFQNKTTGLHNLKTDDYVSSFNVTENDIATQEAICKKLDLVDGIIRMHQKQLQKLDDLIKARFVEMFGDSEFNTMQWPTKKLSELCNVGSSKRIYQNEQCTEGIPFLRISDLNERIDNVENVPELFIPTEKYNELKETDLVPTAGDILVTSRGTLGRCYIVRPEDEFYFQDGMISWLSDLSHQITSLYLSQLFGMSGIQKQIASLQAGSTVAYLSISMLKRLDIMLPPLNLQNQFAVFFEQTNKSKAAIQKALDEAQLLFDGLMQKYFG